MFINYQMYPDRAIIYVASIEDEEYKNEKINYWDSVINIDFI